MPRDLWLACQTTSATASACPGYLVSITTLRFSMVLGASVRQASDKPTRRITSRFGRGDRRAYETTVGYEGCVRLQRGIGQALCLKVFELSQTLSEKWLKADVAAKRELLETLA
jgi:hypothetical protein